MNQNATFDEIVNSNQLFVHHGGYYFTLNSEFYTTAFPKGSEPTDLLPISSLGDAAILTSLAPELAEATALYEREVNNVEGRFLLSQGTIYIVDVGEGRLAQCVQGFVHESELRGEEANWMIRGKASYRHNHIAVDKAAFDDISQILFDMTEEERTARTFREENTHLVDVNARLALRIEDHELGISHHLLTDEIRQASIKAFETLEDNYLDIDDRAILMEGTRTGKPILDALYEEYELDRLDPERATYRIVSIEASQQASDIHESLGNLLSLDSYSFVGCNADPAEEHTTVQNASDDDPDRWKNAAQDAEIMAKFHVLRMEVEDMIAETDDTYHADYYSPETRATRVLAAAVPALADVYSNQWLPIITIMTHVESPELRGALLQAHIAENAVPHLGDGKAGEITSSEQAALAEALAMQGTHSLHPVRLEEGTLAIGEIDIPITSIEDEGPSVHGIGQKVPPINKR